MLDEAGYDRISVGLVACQNGASGAQQENGCESNQCANRTRCRNLFDLINKTPVLRAVLPLPQTFKRPVAMRDRRADIWPAIVAARLVLSVTLRFRIPDDRFRRFSSWDSSASGACGRTGAVCFAPFGGSLRESLGRLRVFDYLQWFRPTACRVAMPIENRTNYSGAETKIEAVPAELNNCDNCEPTSISKPRASIGRPFSSGIRFAVYVACLASALRRRTALVFCCRRQFPV